MNLQMVHGFLGEETKYFSNQSLTAQKKKTSILLHCCTT